MLAALKLIKRWSALKSSHRRLMWESPSKIWRVELYWKIANGKENAAIVIIFEN
jgi:hypothetical protein